MNQNMSLNAWVTSGLRSGRYAAATANRAQSENPNGNVTLSITWVSDMTPQ